MASKSEKDTSSNVSDKDEGTLKKFSEFHICLDELQETNRRILSRLDNLIQTLEEDHRTRFQEGNGHAIAELENRIRLIESHDRRRENELKELQQSLKSLVEKNYGMISSGGPRATIPSLGKNVEITAAGISDVGSFQQKNDVAVCKTSIQQEILSGSPEHGLSRMQDPDKHTSSSINVLHVFQKETEQPVLEGSKSRDELNVVKPNATGLSALDVLQPETVGHIVIKEHPSSLRDSKETFVDTHVTNILEPDKEGHAVKENTSSAESSTIDASSDCYTQGNRSVKLESNIVNICHSTDYTLRSLQSKDLGQGDHTEKKAQPSGSAYTESHSGHVYSASNTSGHMIASSQQRSINKIRDSVGKNLTPQRNKNVMPKIKQDASSTDSYSSQPVLKQRAAANVTSSDHPVQQNSDSIAKHQNIMNFSKKKRQEQENIDLDYGVEEEYMLPEMWKIHAQAELDQALKNMVREIHTVLCVDISASMRGGEAWDQAQIFVRSFVTGLKEVVSEGDKTPDFVSLSVFGHETRVIQRLTNDFHLLHTSFDKLKLGGPTQMYGGLLMALAGVGAFISPNLNRIRVHPRIILISDGKPTAPSLRAGPDIYDESDQEEIESEILMVVDNITERNIKIHCIPVGSDPNVKFLEKIAKKSKGKMFTHKDGRYLARRTRNIPYAGHALHHWKIMNAMQSMFGGEVLLEDLIMGMERGSLAAITMPGSDEMAHQSKADKEQILALAKEAHEEDTFEDEDIMSPHYESSDPSSGLPPLGSRVSRGPDWDNGMQDSGGPGTVIGHVKDRKHEIYVTWDRNGETANYRFGPRGYDVVLVEEPRLLQFDELIGTGCVVRRGKDWKYDNQDGVPGTKGVVIKVIEDGHVIVRWPDKSKNVYRFGAEGCFDLEICNPFDDSSIGRKTQAADNTSSFG
ncbi:hypothetical protein ACJMK2_043235 [Sinanodonta woodiana]|uniref:Uncharacterized protein n=1 Tax=Sinanodonta woodiana TaxID=1069815 RepID=A0ABD3VWB0_SINWO